MEGQSTSIYDLVVVSRYYSAHVTNSAWDIIRSDLIDWFGGQKERKVSALIARFRKLPKNCDVTLIISGQLSYSKTILIILTEHFGEVTYNPPASKGNPNHEFLIKRRYTDVRIKRISESEQHSPAQRDSTGST